MSKRLTAEQRKRIKEFMLKMHGVMKKIADQADLHVLFAVSDGEGSMAHLGGYPDKVFNMLGNIVTRDPKLRAELSKIVGKIGMGSSLPDLPKFRTEDDEDFNNTAGNVDDITFN
jgi:hypothetical protein